MPRKYYVYIASNWNNKVLYTGVTNNILRRMMEHKQKLLEGFTKKYNINKLLFIQEFDNPTDAISAEKQIKGWLRQKKIDLIKTINPEMEDLSKDLLDPSLRSG